MTPFEERTVREIEDGMESRQSMYWLLGAVTVFGLALLGFVHAVAWVAHRVAGWMR